MKPLNFSFFYKKWHLFLFGLIMAFAITLAEVIRIRHLNFLAFTDSTINFWNGINPYTQEFVTAHQRYFLYTPVFSVLFTPFAYLPSWLSPFVWNIFNFTMFFFSIFSLPKYFTHKQKCAIFLFTLPILGQSLLSFQYNITVAYLFIFSFSLLEKNKNFWAILLIMISGMTKIYGIFALALLLCYPRFWRNAIYAVIIGIGLFALPLLKLSFFELIPYYGEWLQSLSTHQSNQTFDSLFHAQPFTNWLLPHFRMLQISSLAILAVLFLHSRRKWCLATFRIQALGILMSWVVLFSDSAETHTYIIALLGFALWYYSRQRHNSRIDKILFWLNFVLLGLVPIDLIFPKPIMQFITKGLWLNIWVFFFTWLRMMWVTFFKSIEDFQDNVKQHSIHVSKPILEKQTLTLDIVCPCYNPATNFISNLAHSISTLRGIYANIQLNLIVVNDGSTYNFDQATHEELLRQIPNSKIEDIPHAGKGAAVRAGIAESQADYTLYTDIDMPYTIESMCKVINNLFNNFDVVIAVRNKNYYSKLPPIRKLMSHGSRLLNRIVLSTRYTDTQGGLKGLSPAARKIMLRTRISDFLFDTEFILYAEQNKELRLTEIESDMRDDINMSKMSLKIMFRELKNFLRIAFIYANNNT